MHRLLPLLALLAAPLPAQLVTYTFGSAASPTTAPASVAAHLTAGAFSAAAGSPGTASGSPVHSAGSGGSFFTASAWTGAAPGANRFEFTVTPAAGFALAATSLSFAYRATASGPVSFALRTSADAFASDLLAGTLTNDSTWRSSGTLSLALPATEDPLVLRLHASGASSALGTLRIDDLALGGTVSAVPEPATAAVGLGGVALLLAAAARRRPGARKWQGAARGRP